MRHVLQITQAECGLACIATVMSHHRKGCTLRQLRREHEVGRDGMTLRQLVAVFRGQGYQATAVRVSGSGFDQVPVPYVAHWRNSHFVVVRGVTATHVAISDPASGPRRLTRAEFADGFSGHAVVARPDPRRRWAAPPSETAWPVLLPFVRRAAPRLLGLLLSAGAVFGLSLLTPQVVQRVVDGVVTGDGAASGTALLWLAAATAAGSLTATLVNALLAVSASVRLGRDVETTVFTHLLRLPYRYFSLRATGDLLNRLSTVKQLRTLIANDLVSGVVSLLLVVVLSVYLALLSPWLWLVATALFVAASLVLLATRRPLDRAAAGELEQSALGNGIQVDAVATASVIKASGAEAEYTRAWCETNDRALAWTRRRSAIEAVVSSLIGFVQVLGPVLLTLLALARVLPTGLSLGQVLAAQVVASTFFAQVSTVFRFALRAVEADAMLARVEDILEQDEDDTFTAGWRTEVGAEVELRGVGFAYTRGAAPVLHEVSLRVPAGAKVAVVGPSGSGKSTLAKVLAGLYPPTSGEVRYGGHPLGEHTREAFYAAVSYVEQNSPLQNKTIRDNVLWGSPERTHAEVVTAARAACIHDDVVAMPLGYDTMITQLGANVSGGQRQRIVLARALLRRPRVLLLDEATSALDQRNEAAFARALAERSMTRIVVAHRLATVQDADLVVVMSGGRIVQQGTHDELVRHPGVYRSLYAAAGAPAGEDVAPLRGEEPVAAGATGGGEAA